MSKIGAKTRFAVNSRIKPLSGRSYGGVVALTMLDEAEFPQALSAPTR